jgi:hypothetical protein
MEQGMINYLYPMFKKYEQKADSLEDFILKFMNPEHYKNNLQEVIARRKETLQEHGYTIIVDPINCNADIAVYYGKQ